MAKLRIISAIALLAAFSTLVNAETANEYGADDGRPSRGMTQARVESKYGSPVSTEAAVGEPPITRWEYSGFVVFFEYDRVIHAVKKR